MRVLYWIEAFKPSIGGIEVLSANLLPALRALGYEFTVITTQHAQEIPTRDHFEGIPIHRFPFWKVLSYREPRMIREICAGVTDVKRSVKPDIIHLASLEPSLFFHRLTGSVCPAPTLASMHGIMPSRVPATGLLPRVLSAANHVSVISQAVRDDVLRTVPALRDRITVILNALPTPALPPAPLCFDPPQLLCVGRVVRDKGFDLALAAFAKVLRSYPAARLVIAGSGEERENLGAQARELGIADAVQFPGWVVPEDIPALLNRSTLVVMPSRWQEPFGLVALQAAQMGRPIVATRVGGIPEVVMHERTGLLVPNEDADALAQAILRLLSDPAEAARMGQAAYCEAQARFSFTRMVGAYDALYRRVAADGAART